MVVLGPGPPGARAGAAVTGPATDELRQLLEDHRATGSVYLPAVADAALRSVSDEALAAELARRGRVRHPVEIVEAGTYRSELVEVGAVTLHGSIDLAALPEGTHAVLEVRRVP